MPLSPSHTDWSITSHFEDDDADLLGESQNPHRPLPAEIPDSQPDSPDTPREIADSQDDLLDIDLPDADPIDESSSFHTTATEIIFGGTKLTPKLEPRYLLHVPAVGANGRLPVEAPQYRLKDNEEEMEEEATQPSTQPYLDPRRRGHSNRGEGQDEADIFCILVPASPPAHEAVKLTARAAPQHILQNQTLSQVPEEDEDLMEDLGGSDGDGPARDLALRFSSKVHNPCFGFTFGRNPKLCDVILGDINNKKFSNRHFRIFIQPNGSLMLEDTSTNGTIVDGTVLRGAKGIAPDGIRQPMHTLHHGFLIELPTISSKNEESLRFMVRMPSRDDYEDRYKQNLGTYLAYVAQAERQAAAARQAAANGQVIAMPPVPMTALWPGPQQETTPNGSILAAATSSNNHGLHWNGGEKYNVVNYIGKGAFAMVYKLSSKRDGELYAVKEVSKKNFIKDGILGHKFHNELNVMKSLHHPNIVQYIENHETSTHLFIIMEFVSYGDLTNWTKSGNAMPEFMCAHVARQILQALRYLHKRGITHRDIKPDNILMASGYPYVFKLSDFGLSKVVTSEETFLKTFCGTILYCAPEVYPGFSRVKARLACSTKRTRANDGRALEHLPYKHSVDTWSLGAVLFHLVCGKSAYPAPPNDHSSLMLTTVMETEVDWDSLRQIGVSEHGIDFLMRMLQIEPSQRARDNVLLQHLWVASAHDAPGIEAVNDSDELDELDASQLSLAEDDEDGDGLDDNMGDLRDPKRLRALGIEDEDHGLWGELLGQPLPDFTRPPPSMSHPPPPNRLFGEIGSSALRSSGVLGQNAHVALGVTTAGSYDPSSAGGSYTDPQHKELASAEGPHTDADFAAYHHNTNGGNPIQYPHLPSNTTHHSGAPSLFGAEALVGQLNMTSPESGASAPSVDSKPTTPKTPKSRGMSPTLPGSKRQNEDAFSSDDESTSKRSRVGRIQSSPHSRRQSGEPSTRDHKNLQSQGKDIESQDSQQTRERSKSNASLLPTAFNSQDSAQDNEGDKAPSKGSSRPHSASSNKAANMTSQRPSPSKSTTLPSTVTPAPAAGTSHRATTTTDDSNAFAKPPIRFGNLIPTKGSIGTVPKIKISSIATTFGRAKDSTFVHANGQEDRIPKNAIDIQMWYPNINADIATAKDIASNPNLVALISTRTSRYIKVNGIRLMKGKDCWLYGRLKTGDIISVFELPEGQLAKNEKEKEFLRFRCEFFVGASKEVRKEGEKFVVEQEKDKYNQSVARKSRESSTASEAEASKPRAGSEGSNASTKPGANASSTTTSRH